MACIQDPAASDALNRAEEARRDAERAAAQAAAIREARQNAASSSPTGH
ncbi:hypothetical protein AB0424_28500 [Streptomyces sp. NPDC051180]